VITRVSKVGDICGQSILKIDETELIPFSRTTLHLTEEQEIYNKTYLNMVKLVLDTPYFYFSYTYDLTHTLQSLYNAGPDFVTKSLFERVNLF
jgi:phosphatidylinositol 4-phosphatase